MQLTYVNDPDYCHLFTPAEVCELRRIVRLYRKDRKVRRVEAQKRRDRKAQRVEAIKRLPTLIPDAHAPPPVAANCSWRRSRV